MSINQSEELLDTDIYSKRVNTISEIIKWWEKKRILFNAIVLASEVATISFFSEGTKRFGVDNALFWSLAYTIAANMFYTFGWIVGITIRYYKLDTLSFYNQNKLVFYIIGVLFSVLLTVFLYADTLNYFS